MIPREFYRYNNVSVSNVPENKSGTRRRLIRTKGRRGRRTSNNDDNNYYNNNEIASWGGAIDNEKPQLTTADGFTSAGPLYPVLNP